MRFNFLFIFSALCSSLFAQTISLSEGFTLTEIKKDVYIHTFDRCNGLVYIQGDEAIVVSSPPTDEKTKELIDWIQIDKQARIIAYIIDRWHYDAMEGLDIIQEQGIPNVAFHGTRIIAAKKGLPVAEQGFDPRGEISLKNKRVICHYLGEAHTSDGIVVYLPDEKILFAGNQVRNHGGWVGNIADANLSEWSKTIIRVKDLYGDAEIVIPGHGAHGGTELLDYTIDLYTPKYAIESFELTDSLINTHLSKPSFEIHAQTDSLNGNSLEFENARLRINHDNRYLIVESSTIKYDSIKKTFYSPNGNLELYADPEFTTPKEKLYYNKLYIGLREDEIGITIILKEMFYR